jgi:hypothetical protein
MIQSIPTQHGSVQVVLILPIVEPWHLQIYLFLQIFCPLYLHLTFQFRKHYQRLVLRLFFCRTQGLLLYVLLQLTFEVLVAVVLFKLAFEVVTAVVHLHLFRRGPLHLHRCLNLSRGLLVIVQRCVVWPVRWLLCQSLMKDWVLGGLS